MKNEYSVLIGGDYCPTKEIIKKINVRKGVDVLYGELFDQFRKSDCSLINLECPILINQTRNQKPISKIGPSLHTNVLPIKLFKDNGLTALTLANNHIMDYGKEGLQQTVDCLRELNLDFVGAGLTVHEKNKAFIQYTHDNKKISFLNFAENEFSTLHNDFGAAAIDSINNHNAIKQAKRESDFVIVIVHSGHEGYSLPSSWMKKQFRFYVDCGADAVVTHHAHCYSGFELYKNKPIFYGLGNLSFYWDGIYNSPWNYGYLVKLLFSGNTLKFEIIPYSQGQKENMGVSIYKKNSEEYNDFLVALRKLNDIISNDNSLEKSFETFINKSMEYRLSLFYPYTNRVLRYLARKRIIPSFLSKQKKLLYLNLLRCEAHRNASILTLQHKLIPRVR